MYVRKVYETELLSLAAWGAATLNNSTDCSKQWLYA